MENKTEKSVIGILIVALTTLGLSVMPDDTHYSSCLNITAHCERLSSTELTCYPKTDTTKGKQYSECGWVPIIEDTQSSVEIIPVKDTNAKQYLCNTEGCIVK